MARALGMMRRDCWRVRFRLLRLCVVLLVCMVSVGPVLACSPPLPEPVDVAEKRPGEIGCKIEFLRVPRGPPSLGSAQSRFAAGDFEPLGRAEFAFGLESEAFWLTFALTNSDSGPQEVVVDLGQPFLRQVALWTVAPDTAPRLVLSQGAMQDFGDRPGQRRILVSEPVSLLADETARIWIHAVFDGPARLPLSIYPAFMAAEVELRRDLPLLIFVSISSLLLVVILALAVALRSRTALCYAGFFAGVLAYNAQLSGLLFAHVWPGWPEWNAVASHPIGLAAVTFALFFAREFTATGRCRPLLRGTILGLAGVCIVFMAAPLILPLVTVKALAGPIVLAFLVVQCWAAAAAFLDRVPGHAFYVAGTLVLLAYLGAFTVASQIDAAFGPAAGDAVLRYGQLLDGTIFCLAVIRQTWVLRQREIEAWGIAATSQRELASTRHDMRQSLLSLRTRFDRLAKGSYATDPETQRGLSASLDHLAGVIDASVEPPLDAVPKIGSARTSPDEVPLSLLFENVAFMFAEDAKRQGTEIRVVSTNAIVRVDVRDLFRVLSNLVSNAVRHSGSDRILLGVRRGNGTVAIDVLDRGKGVSLPPEIPHEPNLGEGLGLDIVARLCKKNGWHLKLCDALSGGTHIRVSGLQLTEPESTKAGSQKLS